MVPSEYSDDAEATVLDWRLTAPAAWLPGDGVCALAGFCRA